MQRSERIAQKINQATAPVKRLTKRDLAQILGISRPALDRRLHGKVAWKYDELETLAVVLNTTVDELVSDNHKGAA